LPNTFFVKAETERIPLVKVKAAAMPSETRLHKSGLAIATDDARQGETSGHMRWVLGISMSLAALAMGAFFIFYTFSQTPH
jgi:hypothetical protein